jgi:hypothetical protein
MPLYEPVDTPLDTLNEVSWSWEGSERSDLEKSSSQPRLRIAVYQSKPGAHADWQTYERLHRRLASRATYDLDYRIYNLKQLAFLIKDNREAIAEALRRDLDKGETSVDLEEVRDIFHNRGFKGPQGLYGRGH